MNEYKASVSAIQTVEKFMSGALDKTIKSAVSKRGWIGGACMAIPLWGIEVVIYAIVLWNTYGEISKISGVPFKDNAVKNIVGGFIINIIANLIFGFILDFIPVVGWLGSFLVGYFSIVTSGMGYVKMLKALHGKNAKADLNVQKGLAALQKKDALPEKTPIQDVQPIS